MILCGLIVGLFDCLCCILNAGVGKRGCRMEDLMDEQLIVVIAGDPDPVLVKDLEVRVFVICFFILKKLFRRLIVLFCSSIFCLQDKSIEYQVAKCGEILGDGLGTNYLYVIRDFEGDYFDKLRKHKKRIFGITAMKQSFSCVENMVTKQVFPIL